MNIRSVLMVFGVIVLALPFVYADPTPTPVPRGIDIEKTFTQSGDELCPGDIIDVRLRLTGVGEVEIIREPLNVVVLVDKSHSMGFDGWLGWNPDLEPPYGTGPDYPVPTPIPAWWGPGGNSPYVETIWAAWKFFEYLIEHPPTDPNDQDIAGLVYYGCSHSIHPDVPEYFQVPGDIPILTPTPVVQNPDYQHPDNKQFWWFEHLAEEPMGGNTAMGPAMQVARDILGAMSAQNPDSRNVMVLMTDGQPNHYYTPAPGEEPPWPISGSNVNRATTHAREIARRSTLAEPLDQGGNRVYPQVWDTTIHSLGLGNLVNNALMQELVDPWNPNYWGGMARPAGSHRGVYTYVQTGSEIEEAFIQIAQAITSDVAGEDIAVTEVIPSIMGGGSICPGGEVLITEVIPGSFNPPPSEIIPPGDINETYQYKWNFDEIYIDQIIDITFQVRILSEDEWPEGVDYFDEHFIECPGSILEYRPPGSMSTSQQSIDDPMFEFDLCITPTPTCVPEVVFFDDFEEGDFEKWDMAFPDSGIRVYNSATYAYDGDFFVLFGGCSHDEGQPPYETCDEESVMFVFLDFSDPVRQGPVLEMYLRHVNFAFPMKSGGGDPTIYDRIIIDVMDENGRRTFKEINHISHGQSANDYLHIRMCLQQFAGSEQVRVRLTSYFPFTFPDPHPWGGEPMVFVDDILVYDYCYDPTPTPTPAPAPPQPIPATGRGGIGLTLIIIGLLILVPMLRKAV